MEKTGIQLKTIVLLFACGGMVFIMVFICAKRQITRYALKSGRGPHVGLGSGAPKKLREEISRRLKRVEDIKWHPKLLSESKEAAVLAANHSAGDMPHFYYRMKAVDAISELEDELSLYNPNIKKKPNESLRAFLIEQRMNGPLMGVNHTVVERVLDYYDHARHDPTEFKEKDYKDYMKLLGRLKDHILKQKENPSGATRPSTLTNTPDLIESASNIETSASVKRRNPRGASRGASEESNRQDTGESDSGITYRPVSRHSGGGALRMTARDSTGSSQGDRSSLDSDRSICGSVVSHRVETPV